MKISKRGQESIKLKTAYALFPGKKRMHAAEFARGFNMPVGLGLE